MNTRSSHALRQMVVASIVTGLLAAACGGAKAVTPTTQLTVPTKAPTTAPTKPPAITVAPAKPTPTTAPTNPPTPTTAPTKAPTPTMAPANTPATGQTPATLGISITLDNLMYLPTTAERVDQIGTDKAQADHQFVLITVTVGNTSQKETLKFDPATFILTSTKSITNYTPVSLKSLKDELKEQELKPGAESKGVIVFTVPKSDTNLELMVKGSTGHQVMWTLTNTKVGAVMQRHSG